jgi:hypothetical protein
MHLGGKRVLCEIQIPLRNRGSYEKQESTTLSPAHCYNLGGPTVPTKTWLTCPTPLELGSDEAVR